MSIHNVFSTIYKMYIPNYITPQPVVENKSILTTINKKKHDRLCEPISLKRTNTQTFNEWKTIIQKQYTVKNET